MTRSSVVLSNSNIHTDSVELSELECFPCRFPFSNLVCYNSVCLILQCILIEAIAVPFCVTRNGISLVGLIVREFVGAPACTCIHRGAVAVSIRSLCLIFAFFPQIFLDERPGAEVVTCFICQIAVFIERFQGVVDDHHEFIFVVADKETDLGEIHFGICVVNVHIVDGVCFGFAPSSDIRDNFGEKAQRFLRDFNIAIFVCKCQKTLVCFNAKILTAIFSHIRIER